MLRNCLELDWDNFRTICSIEEVLLEIGPRSFLRLDGSDEQALSPSQRPLLPQSEVILLLQYY